VTEEIKKDRKIIGAMFSSIAPVYDFLNKLLSLGQDSRWRWQLVKGTKLPESGRVLDLCTGTGDIAVAFLRANPDYDGTIYALDFSALMIDKAREKVAKLGPPFPRKIDFLMGDALDLQFPDDKFDIVTVAFGVRNFTDIKTGLEEIHRVLRPGGQLSVLEFFPDGIGGHFVKWYLDTMVPLIGNMVSHTNAYSYLRRSSDDFFTTKEFESMLKSLGFIDISWERLTFGIAHIVRAKKGEYADEKHRSRNHRRKWSHLRSQAH
jgi:demethylmenaquinone methyltransferase / 2-methoxy-6-polyprenyl-1,4-benzoquinol methylase